MEWVCRVFLGLEALVLLFMLIVGPPTIIVLAFFVFVNGYFPQ